MKVNCTKDFQVSVFTANGFPKRYWTCLMVKSMKLTDITVTPNRREVTSGKVKELAESISVIGLMNPITVNKNGVLIAGAHRIEAYKLLGLDDIPCNIVDLNDMDAELAEIDENLIRNELHYTKRGDLLVRRQEIYDEKHPEAKKGQYGYKGTEVKKAENEIISFSEDTATKTSVSQRTIQQEMQISKNLTPESKSIICQVDLPKTDALKLARMKPEQQKEIIAKIASGEIARYFDTIVDGESVGNDKEYVRAISETAKPHVANNSGNNEWYTPAEFIEAARSVMGIIDLDPASSDQANETVKAVRYYTKETDGLLQEWAGNVWMNPPFAGELIGRFADKLVDSVQIGKVQQGIVLVNNATETTWFGKIIGVASAIVFPSSRVKFNRPDGTPGAPLQGQAVIYIGNNAKEFLSQFAVFGWGAIL